MTLSAAGVSTIVLVLVAAIAILAVAWTWQHTMFGESDKTGDKKREGYEDAGDVKSSSVTIVLNAFKAVLGRKPTTSELDFYAGEIDGARLSEEDVMSLLRISNSLSPPMMEERFPDKRGYGAVINAFASVLFRLPTEKEADAYYTSVVSGAMTTEALEVALRGSEEYKRASSFNISQSTSARSESKSTSARSEIALRRSEAPSEAPSSAPKSTPKSTPSAMSDGEESFEAEAEEYEEETANDSWDAENAETTEHMNAVASSPTRGPSAGQPTVDLTRVISDVYLSVFGTTPPPETLTFLKSKFTGSNNVDRGRIDKFVKLLHVAEEDGTQMYTRDNDDFYADLEKHQQTKFNQGDLVLSSQWNWTVPQKRAPVCIPRSSCNVCPQSSQSSLIGTLLSDASATKVGSILPKFVYTEEQ